MATRTESRLGYYSSLGTTEQNIFSASSTTNVLLNATNRTTSSVSFSAYVASSSWSSGVTTNVLYAVVYKVTLAPNDPPVQISGFVMNANEKLIVVSDTASSVDVSAHGVVIA